MSKDGLMSEQLTDVGWDDPPRDIGVSLQQLRELGLKQTSLGNPLVPTITVSPETMKRWQADYERYVHELRSANPGVVMQPLSFEDWVLTQICRPPEWFPQEESE